MNKVNGAPGPRCVRSVADVLAGIPLFRVLGEEGATAAARRALCRPYAPGRLIWYQGDPGEHLYAVLLGLVKVVFTSERGYEMVLNIMGPGETFGELALLDGSPRSASVIALRSARRFRVL